MYGLKPVRKRHHDALTWLGWDQLEVLLADWYRGKGYEIEHTGTAASRSKYDGGIDLKLRRPGEYVLVQVKHWNVDQVPHNEVHQLLGLMVNEGATGAILITSGEFTRAAIEAATRNGHVRLIDGDELRAMLGPLPEPRTTSESWIGKRGRYGVRRRSADDFRLGALLFRVALAFVVMVFVVRVVENAFQRMTVDLQRSVAKPPPASPAHLSSNIVPGPSAALVLPTSQTTPAAMHAPTPAEVHASQRKADEAMKVLAPSTPEM